MIFILVFVSIISILAYFITFELLVRREYKQHRSHWEKDGRPRGIFWSPLDTRLWVGTGARNRLYYRWLFRSPEWMRNDPQAFNLLILYRVSWCLWNSLFVAPLVIVVAKDVFR
jgi:hypothetical protein